MNGYVIVTICNLHMQCIILCVCYMYIRRLTGHNEIVYIMVVTLTHLHSNAS